MHQRRPAVRSLSCACLSTSLALALAATVHAGESGQADDRWLLGAGASVREEGYAGQGTRVRPFPLVVYEGERVFWRGLGGGVHLYKGQALSLDALVAGRFDGVDIKDLGRRELAANGLDADLLDDRDDAADIGLRAAWRFGGGSLAVTALADVTDTSGGYEAGLQYSHALHWGRTRIVPEIGVRWRSSDMADYSYGTLDSEVARGVVRYRPGSVVIPHAGVAFSRPLAGRWSLHGALDYRALPDEITDSPLMDPDTSGSLGVRVGIGWSY